MPFLDGYNKQNASDLISSRYLKIYPDQYKKQYIFLINRTIPEAIRQFFGKNWKPSYCERNPSWQNL